MKNLMGKVFCLMAFLSLLGITSCNKVSEEDIFKQGKDEKISLQNKYIKYESSAEYHSKLKEIVHMTHEERANYEMANGYISFGRYCDELYNNINFEQFKSQEEIIAFVNNNKAYLKLTEEDNGEYTLDVVYNDKLSRYMYGVDKIFIIADTAYKVLDTKLVTCSLNNVDELSKITEDNYLSYSDVDKFVIFDSKPIINTTKDVANNHGIYLRRTEEDGAEQTRAYGIIEIGPPVLNSRYTITSGAEVRPYHRVLGVWYYCSRTLDLNTKFYTHYKLGTVWYSTTEYTFSDYGVYGSVLTTYTVLPFLANDAHFGNVYVYGDSPETVAAIIDYY
jgi:hypothetical protein